MDFLPRSMAYSVQKNLKIFGKKTTIPVTNAPKAPIKTAAAAASLALPAKG